MSNMFDEFDKKVSGDFAAEVKKAAEENNFEEVPAGRYIAKIEKLDVTKTKKDNKPMFSVQMRLTHGATDKEEKYLSKFQKKKPCVFLNRVIFGTKNDSSMIASVVTFLNKIIDVDDEPVVFVSYGQLYEEVLDIAEDVKDLEFEIDYDASKFNSISIREIIV